MSLVRPQDQPAIAAILARYLPLGESRAEAWAECVCRWRAEPLPDAPASAAGYTTAEVVEAARRHGDALADGEHPGRGTYRVHLRRCRQEWIQRRQLELIRKGRAELPAEAGSLDEDRRRANASRARQIIEDLTAKLGPRSGPAGGDT